MVIGAGPAFAGGGSDSSGEGFHCYLFFELPDGTFSQAMVNDSDPAVVVEKADELVLKYEVDELGTLVVATGNVEGSVCSGQGLENCPCFSADELASFQSGATCSESSETTKFIDPSGFCGSASATQAGDKSSCNFRPSKAGRKCVGTLQPPINDAEAAACRSLIRTEAALRGETCS